MHTSQQSRRLAIVPAYNEQDSVALVVQSLIDSDSGFDVLVVDDGSTDHTARRAREAGATVLSHPFNLGIGGAVQSGYQFALANTYQLAVQIDGDGQHPIAELPKLVARIESDPAVDLVYGSRFLGDGAYRQSFARRAGIRFFATLLSVIMRQKVTDPTSGFRLANERAIELFARDYPHDYPEVEAILMLHRSALKSAEVPVKMDARATGRSSITVLKSGYYMLKVLLAVFIGLFRAKTTVAPREHAPVPASPNS